MESKIGSYVRKIDFAPLRKAKLPVSFTEMGIVTSSLNLFPI
jgi:hypothetical protein